MFRIFNVLVFLVLSGSAPVASQGVSIISRKFNINLQHPIDFNKKFIDKKPILGKGKTLEGSIAGIIAPVILSLFLGIDIYLAFLIGLGAVLGDIVESFIKRRLGIERGEDWLPWDAIDWIVGAIAVAQLWNYLSWIELISMIVIGAVLHQVMNKFARKVKLK